MEQSLNVNVNFKGWLVSAAEAKQLEDLEAEERQIQRLITMSRCKTEDILAEIAPRRRHAGNIPEIELKFSEMADEVRIRDGLQLLKEQCVIRKNQVLRGKRFDGVSA